MILPIYLYSITFFLLFYFTKHKKQRIIYTMLLLMYLLSSLSAIYVSYNLYAFEDVKITWGAVIFHLFFTVLILLQYKDCDKLCSQQLPSVRSKETFRVFTILVIILCLVSIIHSIQNVEVNLLLNDAKALRAQLDERNEISLMGYIAFFGNKYTSVAIALLFYYIIKKPNSKFLIIVLLLCTLTSAISSLQVAGREYILRYMYLVIIAYLITRNQIPGNWKRSLKTYFLIFAVLGFALFMIITIVRFQFNSSADSISGGNNTFNSILSYFGQGWVNFSDVFRTFQKPLTTPGAINFPFFASESISKNNLNDYINVDIYLNNFPTTLGTWVIDGGVVFGAIIAIIFTIVLRIISKLKYSVFTLIYTLWAFEFIFSYMFFFNDTINTSRVASILLVVLFDIIERSSRKRIKS